MGRVPSVALLDVSFGMLMTPLLPRVRASKGRSGKGEGEEGESSKAEHVDVYLYGNGVGGGGRAVDNGSLRYCSARVHARDVNECEVSGRRVCEVIRASKC